jgi:hypothetical protein
MSKTPEEIRRRRFLAKSYGWRPIETPTNDLILRVVQAFEVGMDTARMAKLWGWSEAVCERALHLGLERRRVQRVAQAMGANV